MCYLNTPEPFWFLNSNHTAELFPTWFLPVHLGPMKSHPPSMPQLLSVKLSRQFPIAGPNRPFVGWLWSHEPICHWVWSIVELEKNHCWRCWDLSVFWSLQEGWIFVGIVLCRWNDRTVSFQRAFRWLQSLVNPSGLGLTMWKPAAISCEAGVVSSIHDATGRQHTDDASILYR